jgi:HEAT repeat protein
VRWAVCRVLTDIGTARSIPTLKKLESDENATVQGSAKRALDAIEKRK